MRRRTFLTMLGGAAIGGAGALGTSLGALPEDSEDRWDLGYAASPPSGARLGSQRIIWSAQVDQPVVAFTFDDGPDPALTPRVLDLLDRYDVKATFCAMGYNAVRVPDLTYEIVSRGHEVVNHTWSHLDLSREDPPATMRELELGREALESVTGQQMRFFRPPRGQLTGTAMRYAKEQGHDILLWSVGRGVAGEGTPAAVREHVLSTATPGDIILFHDGIGRETFDKRWTDELGPNRRRREVELEALPAVIEGVLERGMRPTTISEMLTHETSG